MQIGKGLKFNIQLEFGNQSQVPPHVLDHCQPQKEGKFAHRKNLQGSQDLFLVRSAENTFPISLGPT